MALIVSGETTVFECFGCGEVHLEGRGPHRSRPGALQVWREKHAGCPSVPTAIRAAAPELEHDLAKLVGVELDGLVEAVERSGPSMRQVFVLDRARSVAHLVVEKLELALLPGRLEAATHMVNDLNQRLDAAAEHGAALVARQAETDRELERLRPLAAEATRFYRADGSHEEAKASEVRKRRIAAAGIALRQAQEIEQLQIRLARHDTVLLDGGEACVQGCSHPDHRTPVLTRDAGPGPLRTDEGTVA